MAADAFGLLGAAAHSYKETKHELAVRKDEDDRPASPGVVGWGREGGLRREVGRYVEYGRADYWQLHYQKDPEEFDWFQDYHSLKDYLSIYVKTTDNILIPGCGSSSVGELMFDDGYMLITNIDFAESIIDSMIEKYRDRFTMEWHHMNVCAMEFPVETYDVVFAKGLIDAIMCGESWATRLNKCCEEVSRVLKPSGTFIVVTAGIPEKMIEALEGDGHYHWRIEHVHALAKPVVNLCSVPDTSNPRNVHYIYVMEKQAESGIDRAPPKKNFNKQTKVDINK